MLRLAPITARGVFIASLLGIFKRLLEKDPSIITQANEALVYLTEKDNLSGYFLCSGWELI
jgi:hypothetical protein